MYLDDKHYAGDEDEQPPPPPPPSPRAPNLVTIALVALLGLILLMLLKKDAELRFVLFLAVVMGGLLWLFIWWICRPPVEETNGAPFGSYTYARKQEWRDTENNVLFAVFSGIARFFSFLFTIGRD